MSSLKEAFILLDIKDNFQDNFQDNTIYDVKLPQIYKKLILGNFNFSSKNVYNNTMIINLCKVKLENPNNKFINNFRLDDSYNQSYSYFKNIMEQCIKLIKIAEYNNYPVIVNCAAGINRSCSVIVAYAISKGLPIEATIKYIVSQKQNKYGNKWPTLTNTQFIQYLKKMKSELNELNELNEL